VLARRVPRAVEAFVALVRKFGLKRDDSFIARRWMGRHAGAMENGNEEICLDRMLPPWYLLGMLLHVGFLFHTIDPMKVFGPRRRLQ